MDSKWIQKNVFLTALAVPAEFTDRAMYETERNFYRVRAYDASRGMPLAIREYYFYKHIAEKYDWPYIKEIYDK